MVFETFLSYYGDNALLLRVVFIALSLCFLYCSSICRIYDCLRKELIPAYIPAFTYLAFSIIRDLLHMDFITRYGFIEYIIEFVCLNLSIILCCMKIKSIKSLLCVISVFGIANVLSAYIFTFAVGIKFIFIIAVFLVLGLDGGPDADIDIMFDADHNTYYVKRYKDNPNKVTVFEGNGVFHDVFLMSNDNYYSGYNCAYYINPHGFTRIEKVK